MKLKIVISFIFILLVFKSSFSQNEKGDLLNYVGTYYFIQPAGDKIIKYDYITLYEKKGKVYCSRDFSFNEGVMEGVYNTKPTHQDYEVLSLDLKKGVIVLKYLKNKCEYKINTNCKGQTELIIRKGVLVYERR